MEKLLLTCALVALHTAGAIAQTPAVKAKSNTPLSGEEVVKRLIQRNLERAAALHCFEGSRTYRLEYRGFPGSREAEMVATVAYRAPESKEFNIVSQKGSKLIIDRVFRKLLESEQEALQPENRARTELNTDNYVFELTGYEASGGQTNYVFRVEPRSPSKFVYRGTIWVDGRDFAVSRMQVEPAKSPSFWTKHNDVQHIYAKVEGFWLPQKNRSVSTTRLGGQAVLTIDYTTYKIRELRRGCAVEPVHPPG
jgi:hypothetical protein